MNQEPFAPGTPTTPPAPQSQTQNPGDTPVTPPSPSTTSTATPQSESRLDDNNIKIDNESFERMAESVKEQAGKAAEAFSRSEFIQNSVVDPASNADDRLVALLCYASQIVIPFLMPVIVLMSESSKKRPFQRFHAVQSLSLVTAFALFVVAMTVASGVIQIIPLLGQLVAFLCILPLVFCLTPILYIMTLGYYGLNSYQGKRFAIPGLTGFLRDQGWI